MVGVVSAHRTPDLLFEHAVRGREGQVAFLSLTENNTGPSRVRRTASSRTICVRGMPLGDTTGVGHSAMVNLIGRTPALAALAVPGAHLHLYGRSPQPGRELGHATLRAAQAEALGQSLEQLLRLAEEADYR